MGELEQLKGKRWDDLMFWGRVTVGRCTGCGEGHVLKDGLCWLCRPERNPRLGDTWVEAGRLVRVVEVYDGSIRVCDHPGDYAPLILTYAALEANTFTRVEFLRRFTLQTRRDAAAFEAGQ